MKEAFRSRYTRETPPAGMSVRHLREIVVRDRPAVAVILLYPRCIWIMMAFSAGGVARSVFTVRMVVMVLKELVGAKDKERNSVLMATHRRQGADHALAEQPAGSENVTQGYVRRRTLEDNRML